MKVISIFTHNCFCFYYFLYFINKLLFRLKIRIIISSKVKRMDIQEIRNQINNLKNLLIPYNGFTEEILKESINKKKKEDEINNRRNIEYNKNRLARLKEKKILELIREISKAKETIKNLEVEKDINMEVIENYLDFIKKKELELEELKIYDFLDSNKNKKQELEFEYDPKIIEEKLIEKEEIEIDLEVLEDLLKEKEKEHQEQLEKEEKNKYKTQKIHERLEKMKAKEEKLKAKEKKLK